MKHPQHILATLADTIEDNATVEGLIKHDLDNAALIIAQRNMLENNVDFRQLLPYIVLARGDRVLVYQRTKLVGEERLAGKMSIGFGGHIDLGDVVYTSDSQIDLPKTLTESISRELMEEVGQAAGNCPYVLTDIGIAMNESPVESVHLGLVGFGFPDERDQIKMEKELKFIGWYTLDEIREQYADKLEPWSRMLVESVGFLDDEIPAAKRAITDTIDQYTAGSAA